MFEKKDKKKEYGYSNYYYSSDYSKGSGKGSGIIGPGLNFASREAYKQLRTNLDFALPDVEGCRAIGITSAQRGDGKSLTAINLSYSLAEDGYKTILIEGDLRIPTLGKKLGLENNKGITSILSSGEDFKTITDAIDENDEGGRFDILVAGEIPPNPQEMLGSKRMQELIAHVKEHYDYIIVDLPPITAVADALVASKYLDGMVVVVRRDHTERGALSESVRQLEFSGVRILGFVFNAASDNSGSYSRRYRYRNRYKKYKNYGSYSSRGYGYGYGNYENYETKK